jgi:hypothetical protein
MLALLLVLAVGVMLAARFFSKREEMWIAREEKWRERERVLVDRLLRQANVAPVEIQREQVVKLADPEIQPASWVDESFATDDIKEELEQLYPEAARMSHAEAQARYSREWQRIAVALKERSTPLRA